MINNQILFGLIGKNIVYSFSRNFFLEKFKKESLYNVDYKIFDINQIDKVSHIFKIPYLKGCNVTIPYKTNIIKFLTKVDEKAKKVGSVNVIKILDKKNIIGYNTDVIGFELSFKKDIQFIREKSTKVLILGTGGAAKAVSFVLKNLNFSYKFVSRNKKKCFLSYDDLNQDILEYYKIIINCTPVGTYPNTNFCPPIPYQFVSKKHYFYDLVYNPSKSLFLKKAEKKGAIIRNGLKMLYIQANESWKIWNQS
ncbi:shikimate dehydrogenase family protein [Blattabacterium cuenoti]|uniref:shikimate dehydrogenase family protein n=1 Tax=Blattabacterium cuenoti TaxID=1653831 RepID=UPI00163C6A51|nr:shikimate dehydrogenase [Blattabacterium cuenoti]